MFCLKSLFGVSYIMDYSIQGLILCRKGGQNSFPIVFARQAQACVRESGNYVTPVVKRNQVFACRPEFVPDDISLAFISGHLVSF